MIVKDEAHHIYSFEKAWKKILLGLNKDLFSRYGKGITMELDFSATPKTETGALFPWIIVDFSLKEAIEMNIVKLPLKGIVKKADLPKAREFAKTIDDPEKNPYEAIVSTLMLNEGWDVRNVNVIVGLRSYTSKRKVLPEQVIGRGLRKMFPEEAANVDKSVNVLEVIGPPGLIDILEELENQEGIKFAKFDTGKSPNLTTIYVDENKLEKDNEIPILSPRVLIREFYLDEIDISRLPSLNIPLENKVLEMEYVAVDMLKGMEVIKRKWDLPVPQDSKSVIAYYTDQIQKDKSMVWGCNQLNEK
jgi:type III restriction enzyme